MMWQQEIPLLSVAKGEPICYWLFASLEESAGLDLQPGFIPLGIYDKGE